MSNVYLILTLVALLAMGGTSFEIPGLTPQEYQITDVIDVYAGVLSAPDTILKYNYYHLNFCQPDDKLMKRDEVSGSLSQLTPYKV